MRVLLVGGVMYICGAERNNNNNTGTTGTHLLCYPYTNTPSSLYSADINNYNDWSDQCQAKNMRHPHHQPPSKHVNIQSRKKNNNVGRIYFDLKWILRLTDGLSFSSCSSSFLPVPPRVVPAVTTISRWSRPPLERERNGKTLVFRVKTIISDLATICVFSNGKTSISIEYLNIWTMKSVSCISSLVD